MLRGHRAPIFIDKNLDRSCFFKLGFFTYFNYKHYKIKMNP